MIIKGKEYYFLIGDERFHCAMDVTMKHLGGKWKTVVLWYLQNKTYRFGELKRQIPDITEKMLSIQLKALERDGIILRKSYNEKVARVEYSLTEFGKTLIPVLKAMAKWGKELGNKRGELVEK